ncbi:MULTISPECIES: type II toxin-antitoxin system PemK/MazF family toxin [unclassified Chamaesiphon]|uniref:type II toxin-antitoxin system PemK/MazF family toxin n=1 Tax=unclassified Chamaesiphon TaxID=2620921 RepID=UPI00286A7485|nr:MULTISPECIES: type II toxin-antitoxin system PemK/MazF family toxin [unclassified Chamaesiphon]
MLRGEIWLVNLAPTVDSEIRKTRPCAIVNDDAIGVLPLKVIVPITDWKEAFSIRPWMVGIEPTHENGSIKSSAADTFQIRSVAESRLVRKIGNISDENLVSIEKALTIVLKLR